MSASGAGLNRIGSYGGKLAFTQLSNNLYVAKNVVAASGVLTVGTNDTGPIMLEGRGFSAWKIQPTGTWGSGTAQVQAWVLGTIDQFTSGYTDGSGVHASTAKNWFPLPAPSIEGGSGDAFSWANPLLGNNSPQVTTLSGLFADGTNVTDALYVKLAGLTAVRIIVVPVPGAVGAPVNPNCNLLIYAAE